MDEQELVTSVDFERPKISDATKLKNQIESIQIILDEIDDPNDPNLTDINNLLTDGPSTIKTSLINATTNANNRKAVIAHFDPLNNEILDPEYDAVTFGDQSLCFVLNEAMEEEEENP